MGMSIEITTGNKVTPPISYDEVFITWLPTEGKEPILTLQSVSPDGRWSIVGETMDGNPEHPSAIVAYPNEGGRDVLISWVLYDPEWTADGKYLLIRAGVNADLKDVGGVRI